MTKTLYCAAVIGGGIMDAGIAEVTTSAGHLVLLYDIFAEAITHAIEGIRQRPNVRVGRGKISTEQASELLARIIPVIEPNQLANAQLVIGAASEQLEIRKALFSQLAEICSPSTPLTSNTSPILITVIAAEVRHPECVAGLHFLNPAPVMRLVEVVGGLATSTEVVELLCQCVITQSKQLVRCRLTPGFIVNHVARLYCAEAQHVLGRQAASAEVIDAALRGGGGFPTGPLALTDLIGQGVNFAVTCSVFSAFWQDHRSLPSLLQQELALMGRLDKRSGRGVHYWPAEVSPELTVAAAASENAVKSIKRDVVTELDDVLLLETVGETTLTLGAQHRRPVVVYDHAVGDIAMLVSVPAGLVSTTDRVVCCFQQQGKKTLYIADHLGLLVWHTVTMPVNEALDTLQKGVASVEDIDITMRLGVNYPRGPLAWGDSFGQGRVLHLLESLQ